MKTEVVIFIGGRWNRDGDCVPSDFGKHILLADFNEALLASALKELEVASYKVSSLKVDVSSRESVRALADKAASLGSVVNRVNTAGLSPNMAPPERVLAVDLYGSAVVFEEFERVIAEGGSELVVSRTAGYVSPALPKEQDHALAFTSARELLKLPFLSAEAIPNSMVAYIISKRANHLRVQASSISWGSAALVSTPSALESSQLHSLSMN